MFYLRFIQRNCVTRSETYQAVLSPIGAVSGCITCTTYVLCYNNFVHRASCICLQTNAEYL